jgi:hypothetical protein
MTAAAFSANFLFFRNGAVPVGIGYSDEKQRPPGAGADRRFVYETLQL